MIPPTLNSPNSDEPALRAFDCYRCGYDLRAHVAAERCPECGFAVALSRARFEPLPERVYAPWFAAIVLGDLAMLYPIVLSIGYHWWMQFADHALPLGVAGWLATLLGSCALIHRLERFPTNDLARLLAFFAKFHRAVTVAFLGTAVVCTLWMLAYEYYFSRQWWY